MSNPNKNNNNSKEKVSIEDAIQFLEDFREWLMKASGTEVYLESDYAVKAIRALERAISYIKWARGILKSSAKQNSFNKTYTSYKKPLTRSYSYRKPYTRRSFKGGRRTWRKYY